MWRILSVLLALLVSSVTLADGYNFPVDKINETLKYIAIDTSDLYFRTDYVDPDSFRLELVDYFTHHPLEIPDYLNSLGNFLRSDSTSIPEQIDSLALMLSSSTRPITLDAKLFECLSCATKYLFSASRAGGNISKLAKQLNQMLNILEGAQQVYQERVLSSLSVPERAFVQDRFSLFLLEDVEDVNRSADEQDSLQKLNDSLAIRFKDIGPGIDMQAIILAGRMVIAGHEMFYNWLLENKSAMQMIPQVEIERYFRMTVTPAGRVAVGGMGDDHYSGDYALIVDFGGNDEYVLTTNSDHRQQVIIDLEGDDKYYAASDYLFGAGFLGCGILDDWNGNDIYLARNFSLGCGLFGTGILIDRAGNDYYQGDICTQAAASFGIGTLLDFDGHDTYNSNFSSQGFGFIMGIADLVDRNGNDNYTAGWKYGDVLRYENHYLSLSQGFGHGLRPHYSGGVGLLIDGAGNDLYNADIFGQGASYWFALGGLIDYSGTDRYIAHQYAQGSATHLCLAALIDIEGDDLYSSKGVSQGCGHDLAFGLLLDCRGNDQYNAFDLSQAAGSANGYGMLIDLAGNDGYMARIKRNTHGYGNPRRDYGSIGLFLDLDGTDDYRGYGANNLYWITDSKWGIGADLSVEKDSAR